MTFANTRKVQTSITLANKSYLVYANPLDESLLNTQKIIFSTINQYSFCLAQEDNEFKDALQQSDVLLPDGISIVHLIRLLTGKKLKKIAGSDLHEFFLARYSKKGGSCFYLGSSQSTLDKILKRVSLEYPSLRVGGYSPPYKTEFSDEDNLKMIKAVNDFKPDVLFIGMTAPKQEKWANKFKDELDVQKICSIGAVFDFYAGTVKRPSQFWINMGLEWFFRLSNEPRRMWKRYLYYGPIFVFKILQGKIEPTTFILTSTEGK
jgi:N-acetylglucosaminyldiphosphoundecaprenol N-acetyl-beta-D-mannosaminyltransferase